MEDLEGLLRLLVVLLTAESRPPEAPPQCKAMRDLALYLAEQRRTFDRDILRKHDTELLAGVNAVLDYLSPILDCLSEDTVDSLSDHGALGTTTGWLAMALFVAGYQARIEDEKEEQNA